MIKFIKQKLGMKLEKVYFADSELKNSEADILLYVQCKEWFKGSYEFTTKKINLANDFDQVFSKFSKNVRYDIRNVIKLEHLIDVKFIERASKEDANSFSRVYSEFCERKRLRKADLKLLRFLASCGSLSISYVSIRGKESTVLCGHLYMRDKNMSRLLYSFNFDNINKVTTDKRLRNINKYLHYFDMMNLKNSGITFYDFGGISNQNNGIDTFKDRFGGYQEVSYNGIQHNSKAGYIAVLILKIIYLVKK